jgi:hypothetical protein
MNVSWRQFGWALIGYALLEALSIAAYQIPGLRWPLIIGLAVGGLLIFWRRPAWAGYVAFAELVVGGKGYLLFGEVGSTKVPIRMVIYGILLIVAAKTWWQNKSAINWVWVKTWWPPVALAGWVLISTIIGLTKGYTLNAIYTDVNAFLFLAVIPAWWILWRQAKWRTPLTSLLLAGVTLVAIKSWLVLVLFGQNVEWVPEIYRWIRNTGIGEITPIKGQVYRVFFQSQIYGLLAAWVCVDIWRRAPRFSWRLMIPTTAAVMAVIISLSRSFWVGAAVSMAVFVIISLKRWTEWPRLWPMVAAIGLAYFIFSWGVNWPNPFFPPGRTNALASRISDENSGDAATARKNQIQPLLTAIKASPIIGQGFGKTVTYYSTDPRIKGWRTTSAFELGYLDWWLKMGLVGLMILAAWVWFIGRATVLADRYWIWTSLAALLVIHAFTPYINHPLGLGWLALLSIYTHERA